ncbi:MAG TPA: RagB/SusD family nutrient uptake outer membrane protein [Saprospiraceae bacterium]|nr:RagB/SusD family nutrient uptake outer membrane protein [Saprospiraceae bacterium]HMQ81338.1 RagB/SusD family nutrient uptake outer membrane protein [Saprospiraceae bacterium]
MRFKYFFVFVLMAGFWLYSCSDDFLEQPPRGAYSAASLANSKGVEGLLIATYAALDGSWFESWGNNNFNQVGGASNWVWGSIRAEDSYKGTESTDFVDLNPVERYEVQPSNPTLTNKWNGSFDGIGKANETLRTLALAEDITDADRTRITAEARFLRGHFHFEAKKTFGNPPYIDETVVDFSAVTNDVDIWPMIEADFLFAFENLPGTMGAAGRANKWAAAAYLGKTYMYQGKWAEAKGMFDQVISNGTTASGAALALMPNYHDNFDAQKESGNTEVLFAYESSAAGDIVNGNYENTLNQPHGSSTQGAGCCGFFQPSQNMVNSFKVDANGLPMPDTYNDVDVPDDEGLASDEPFTPTDIALDPRLDWTVGRRGIPYLDWGVHPGFNWIRNVPNGGPYSPIKNVASVAELDANLAGTYDWGFALTAQNVTIIRLADVMLLAAEAEAELDNLPRALELVNMVRMRAANPNGFVKKSDGTPAANYQIGMYNSFGSKADALKAIRFERKLELGMEGQRFFDLVRWDNLTESGKTGLAFDIAEYLNDYLAGENDRQHLANASFQEKHKYAPIPESVITQSTVNGVENIKQNQGF